MSRRYFSRPAPLDLLTPLRRDYCRVVDHSSDCTRRRRAQATLSVSTTRAFRPRSCGRARMWYSPTRARSAFTQSSSTRRGRTSFPSTPRTAWQRNSRGTSARSTSSTTNRPLAPNSSSATRIAPGSTRSGPRPFGFGAGARGSASAAAAAARCRATAKARQGLHAVARPWGTSCVGRERCERLALPAVTADLGSRRERGDRCAGKVHWPSFSRT